jgi:hypothetical protein
VKALDSVAFSLDLEYKQFFGVTHVVESSLTQSMREAPY